MYKDKVTVINESGLHARPASMLVKLAKEFSSDIKLISQDKNGVAKSILSVMSLNLAKGDEVEIEAVGQDEKEAVKALVTFIKEGCGE